MIESSNTVSSGTAIFVSQKETFFGKNNSTIIDIIEKELLKGYKSIWLGENGIVLQRCGICASPRGRRGGLRRDPSRLFFRNFSRLSASFFISAGIFSGLIFFSPRPRTWSNSSRRFRVSFGLNWSGFLLYCCTTSLNRGMCAGPYNISPLPGTGGFFIAHSQPQGAVPKMPLLL
jgi:hypothetical protein